MFTNSGLEGDFVGVGVSATRQFSKWQGMAEQYDDICYKPSLSIYSYKGELLGGPWPAKKIDAIPTPVSRYRLIRQLHDFAIGLGIVVTFGQTVVTYCEDTQKRQASVVTVSGSRHQADLVVAADGVGSKSSSMVLGTDSQPQRSGFAVYRTAFPTEVAQRDPEVAQHYPVPNNGTDDVRMYLAPDAHAITLVSKDITTWLLTHSVSDCPLQGLADPADNVRHRTTETQQNHGRRPLMPKTSSSGLQTTHIGTRDFSHLLDRRLLREL